MGDPVLFTPTRYDYTLPPIKFFKTGCHTRQFEWLQRLQFEYQIAPAIGGFAWQTQTKPGGWKAEVGSLTTGQFFQSIGEDRSE